MTERDIRMLKAVKFLLDKGSFSLQLREAPALIEVDKWIGEQIEEWRVKRIEEQKKVKEPKKHGNKQR